MIRRIRDWLGRENPREIERRRARNRERQALLGADDLAGIQAFISEEQDEEERLQTEKVVAAQAAAQGKLTILAGLLDAGLSIESRFGSRTLLEEAASGGSLEATRFLLDRGADAKETLISAIDGGPAIVELLIDAGADVDFGNPGFPTALAMARMDGLVEVEAVLIERGATALVGAGAPPVEMSVQRIIPAEGDED